MSTDSNTRSLAQKTRSLELLYSVASTLNQAGEQDELGRRMLDILAGWLDAEAAVMYRLADGETLSRVAAAGDGGSFPATHRLGEPATCPCARALEAGYVQNAAAAGTCGAGLAGDRRARDLRQVSMPVQTRDRMLGVINLFVSQAALDREDDWAVVLTSIGQSLGMVIERAELVAGSERLSRMEERTHLAHELHDSLAQTLAGIRYGVRVLDSMLERGDAAEAKRALAAVESSVEEANRELRELISRFRRPGESPGLIPSIEEVVARFRQDAKIHTVLHNSVRGIELPLGTELQIVRILQEALANVRKHAGARTVRVVVRNDESGYHLLVEDDGRGFDERRRAASPREHIGLQVMTERAARIGGTLHIESTPAEGTRVHLAFAGGGAR